VAVNRIPGRGAPRGGAIRVLVSAIARGSDAAIEPRFYRAAYLTVVDTETSSEGLCLPRRCRSWHADLKVSARSSCGAHRRRIAFFREFYMRIAISSVTEDGLDAPVAGHFGHSPYFTLIDLDGDQVCKVDVVANPYALGHQPGQVPDFVHSQGVEAMVTGGMGARAAELFAQYGIQPVTGASGTVRDALVSFQRSELTGWTPCSQSVEHGHGA
jgi:predicted Fe-Mo cluster-binding NifX family protein